MSRRTPAHAALIAVAIALVLSACGGHPPRPADERPRAVPPAPTPGAASGTTSGSAAKSTAPAWTLKRGGGFYKDDGPGDDVPDNLDAIPDAVPRAEPLHRFANNPYAVLGQSYVPMREHAPYKARGIGSWYGRKFHGQKTSSGEPYDMFGMTAAHPTLPIPSYVRVTNPANGKSVVVRVNDRGPFHAGRIIDLSYTAAWKLDYIGSGSTLVEVENILPGQVASVAAVAPAPTVDSDALARLTEDAPPPPKPMRPVTTAAAQGHYLQLGAFGNPDNAEAFQAHIARELDWLGERLRIESAEKVHRVHAGPWRDRAEAEQMAERVRLALGVKPTIVRR